MHEMPECCKVRAANLDEDAESFYCDHCGRAWVEKVVATLMWVRADGS